MAKKLINTIVKLGVGTLLKESLVEHDVLFKNDESKYTFAKGGMGNGTDFNNMKSPGVFNVNANNNTTNNLNMPAKVAGMLEVIPSQYFIKQIYTRFDGANSWGRVYYPYADSWSAWKTIW